MKALTLFFIMFLFQLYLVPADGLSDTQDIIKGPIRAMAVISMQDLYAQHCQAACEGFVRSRSMDKYGCDLMRYHPSCGAKDSFFEGAVRVWAHDNSRDSGSHAYPVPEPSSLFLFGLGLIFIAESGRRLKKS